MEQNTKENYLKEKQEKTIYILNNIKSNFIFGKIFDILLEKKKLEIVKYNNTLKNRINININDYIKYYETIEIEIIPNNIISSKFINIKEDEQIYFHIYFNDDKNEIKRYNINENEIKSISINKKDNVSKINIIIDYQVESFHNLF